MKGVYPALNTKHHYRITTVLFVLVLICLIIDLVWMILHPRPTRFFWFLLLLYFAVRLFREKNAEKCIWRQEYKKQKVQAEAAGISYQENRRVVRSPKIYVIEIPLLLFLLFVFLYLPDAAWSYRAPWEYKGEIADYKNMDSEKYKIFPDAIPKTAKYERWNNFPGLGQARLHIYLSMKMPAEYIQDTIKQHAPNAKILSYSKEDEEYMGGWWDSEGNIGCDSFPGIDYEDRQAENVVIYLLSDDCDHETGYGFWVNEQENTICFFANGRS